MAATGTRQTADERRESVLRAALPEFAVGGLAGTSTEAIARRAGISQPYLFRLFPTKKALFLAAVERGFLRVEEAFGTAADGLTGMDALAAMGDAYGDLLADRDLLLTQLHAYAACADPEIRDVTRRSFRRLLQYVERVTGAPPEAVMQFFATGMLINVAAAMDLPAVDERWAQQCLVTGAPAAAAGTG